MNHLDLCSGIGGFALAARWVGWNTIQFVEIEKFCQKVLRKHWPEVPIHDDLKTFNATELNGRVGILTAGYPCQPFSSAGKRRGADDPRHLWPEVYRVIRECRPSWLCMENVAGHVALGLDDVLSDLEDENYTAWPGIIPASSANAPHRRYRLWIIANDKSSGRKRQQLSIRERGSRETSADIIRRAALAPHYNYKRREGGFRETVSRKYRVTRELAGSFEAFNDGWAISTPVVCRVDDGIPARLERTRALGNAIVPQVAYEIFKAIEAAEAMND